MDSLTLKGHNFFQNQNNSEATHGFASRPVIFMLQQEVWKFNVSSWVRAPQNWPADKVFKLRKSKFLEPQFFSAVTF